MSVVQVAAVALGSAFLVFFLRDTQRDLAQLLGIAAAAVLLFQGVTKMEEAVTVLGKAVENTQYRETYHVLLRALGIASVTQIGAEICRDVGAGSIAGQLELFGKLELVLLSIPLAMRLLAMAENLLS